MDPPYSRAVCLAKRRDLLSSCDMRDIARTVCAIPLVGAFRKLPFVVTFFVENYCAICGRAGEFKQTVTAEICVSLARVPRSRF